MPKEQLCWACRNACGNCNWSAYLKPVNGWIAKKINKQDSGVPVETYHIEKCPQYIPDNPPKPKRKQGKGLTSDEKKMIRILRNEGFTQKEIADRIGVSTKTVKKYSAFIRENKESMI